MEVKIAIINHATASVFVKAYDFNEDDPQTEEMEKAIEEDGFSLSQITWQVVENISVNI